MTQMVLPQTPSPSDVSSKPSGKQNDAKASKSGDSQFDQVSQAEEKRIARKQAEKQDQADRQEQSKKPDAASESRDSDRKPDDSKEAAEGKPAEQKTADKPSDTKNTSAGDDAGEDTPSAEIVGEQLPGSGEVQAETVVETLAFTFAGLQDMARQEVAPTTPQGGQSVLMAGRQGGKGGEALLQGLVSQGVIPGLATAGTRQAGMLQQKSEMAPGVTSSLQLTELMGSQLTSESGRSIDPSALLNPRATGLPEGLNQPPNSAFARLQGEAVPLKGYSTSVEVPVGQAEWGEKVMGKLTWLTANKLSTAEIHLTPPDMGPMEVRVQVQQDQTSITVHAANPAVRDQLELHSHRLRDMLSEQGLSLEKFDVSDSPGDQTGEQGTDGDSQEEGGTSLAAQGDAGNGITAEGESVDLQWKEGVDIFA